MGLGEEKGADRPGFAPLWPVRRIKGRIGAAVFLVREREPVLIDAGAAQDVPRILATLETSGLRPRDVCYIVLTHQHLDHAGGAAALREATGAELLVHAADAPYVEGRLPRPRPRGVLLALASRLLSRGCRPARVDGRLFDGDSVAGLQVIHTPGHTPGSICLYLPRSRSLFAGDLLRTTGRKADGLAEMPHGLVDNLALARRSIQRVASLDVDAIYPAHGEVMYSGAGEQLRALARQTRSSPA